MFCHIHQCNHYGYVMKGDKAATEDDIAQLLARSGTTRRKAKKIITNLISLGILSKDKFGFYNKEMKIEYIKKAKKGK